MSKDNQQLLLYQIKLRKTKSFLNINAFTFLSILYPSITTSENITIAIYS
ncbi:hypothetical protein LEQ41_06070 [Streptococcus agalactiae]|nr:hypothetical protein [Streptococcus agalactiae]